MNNFQQETQNNAENQINSHETIEYIAQNYNYIITNNLKWGSKEVIEDCLSLLVSYLLENPRYIPNHSGWVFTSMWRKAVHHKRYYSKFIDTIYNDNDNEGGTVDFFDNIKNNTNLIEEIENKDLFNYNMNKLKEMIEINLTDIQKQSVHDYLKNDATHKNELAKVHFYQSVRKLKNNIHKTPVVKKVYTKKPGRKKGYIVKSEIKLGRKPSLNQHQIDEIRNICKTTNFSLTEIGKKFGVSNSAIKLVIKKHNIEYNSKKSEPYSFDFLKESAKNFNSRFEWQKKFPGQYKKALTMGWLNECCLHMVKYKK